MGKRSSRPWKSWKFVTGAAATASGMLASLLMPGVSPDVRCICLVVSCVLPGVAYLVALGRCDAAEIASGE